MAKANWQKSMSNTMITEKPIHERDKPKQQTIDITLEDRDYKRLRKFIEAETGLYNAINNILGPKLRAFPHELVDFDERFENLFVDLAYTGFNLRSVFYKNKDTAELPPELESHRNFIYGKNDAGNRLVNESFVIMTEEFAKGYFVHPLVRKRMATEMLRFYVRQAKNIMQTFRTREGEIELRDSGEILEPMDIIRKRHLQIPREILDIKWNSDSEETTIINPFCSPIKFRHENINADKRWNLIILHQEPGKMALDFTPWVMEIKHSKAQYLVKYVDVRSPNGGGAFFTAKAGQGKR